MTFIKHGSTLINASAIATADFGQVNTRGSRPVTFLHMAFPLMSIAGWPVPPGLTGVQDNSPDTP